MRKCLVAMLMASVPVVGSAQLKQKFENRFADSYVKPTSAATCGSHLAEINALATDDAKMQLRNQYVLAALSDLADSERWYLGRIQKDRSVIYTIIDVAVAGATAAGGAVGGPTAAKAFVLSATAIGSVKSSIVNNFDGGTANSLATKIQTAFAANVTLIQQNSNLNYQSYSLPAACGDIDALYDSGQKISAGLKVQSKAVVAPGSSSPGSANAAPATPGATIPGAATPAVTKPGATM